MPDNRQVQSNGGVSNSSPNNLEEAMRRFNIHPNGIQDSGAPANLYPDRPGEPDCIYYLRTGLCGYGSNCKFNHPISSSGQVQGGQYKGELPERVGQPDCGCFVEGGAEESVTIEDRYSVIINIEGDPKQFCLLVASGNDYSSYKTAVCLG